MSKVIAVANQKGGVGKSTSVANLGIGLSNLGYKVLAIDLDSQILWKEVKAEKPLHLCTASEVFV